MSAAAPQISVVVPTYREAENLPALAAQVHKALSARGIAYELIIADDVSGDETPAVCAELAARYPLRLLSRKTNRGLSQAVMDGIKTAAGVVVVVMDADLSHPPDKIADLAAPLLAGDADFALGTRYGEGGRLHKDWPLWRRINSLAATLPAKPLAPLSDPMSGFFALRRADMPPAKTLAPIGYKIGLELAVKTGARRIREVPIYFRDRARGESKMNLREQMNYLRHLRRLYHYRWPRFMEMSQFLFVGAIGFVIDVAVYYLLLSGLGAPHLLARAVAYWPAVTSNWFMNRIMTFKTRPRPPALRQWGEYAFFSGLGFLVSWGTYAALTVGTAFFARHMLAALIAGVAAATAFNFVTSNWIVFRRR